jgi:pSer/pThr/pTyr-binding forkhead associated (FHA) protein
MGLQVRLRHALGERVLELPPRTVDRPITVGRGAEADVQVPSIHVGLRQVVLFTHDDRWVVQDAPGGTLTTVNGSALTSARPLKGGDVVAMGSETDAPTLEIDPGLVDPVVEEKRPSVSNAPPPLPAPLAAPADAPAPGPVSGPPPQPANLAPPIPDVIVESAHPPAPAEPDHAGDLTGERKAEPEGGRAELPRGPRRTTPIALAFAMVATVAIVTSVVVFVYIKKNEPMETTVTTVVQQVPRVAVATAPSTNAAAGRPGATAPAVRDVAPPPPPADITDEPDKSSSPATGPAPTSRRAGSTDAPDPQFFGTSLLDDSNATEEQKEWKRVEGVYYHPNVAKALLTFDGYAERYPDAHKEQIAKYREDMLDKLWWQRVESLIDKRKAIAAEIRKTQADIKAETEEPFKKTVLEPRLASQKARAAAVGERLRKEMMYPMDAPPPLGREPQMKALRAKRDVVVYEEWKKKTLKFIRENHGAYPWANEE